MNKTINSAFIAILISSNVYAFKPANILDFSGVKTTHKTITKDAISTFTFKGDILKFSAEAITQINVANGDVDITSPLDDAAHCDAEHIGGSNGCIKRIYYYKKKIIENLTNKNLHVNLARRDLGRMLHTIQDFYSHSNHVNLYGEKLFEKIGTEDYSHSDDIAYERRDGILSNKTCEWDLDKFDHTPKSPLEFGPRGKVVLITGYFVNAGKGDAPKYRCDHGGDGSGLNKDYTSQPKHAEAVKVAKKHTESILVSILEDTYKSSALNSDDLAKNIAKFLGAEETSANLGFIIDTTGSMGDTITGIKNAMTTTVNKLKNEGKDIENFYLISFGDPGVGGVLTANNVDTMLSNINTVTLGIPDDGGDYYELALDGLLKVVNAATNNTELYLYSDAPTKNTGLANQIINIANSKNIKINFFLSGDTASSYTTIASKTGGKLISYAHSIAGAEGTFSQINPTFDGNLEKLLKIAGKIPGSSLSSKAIKSYTVYSKSNDQESGTHVYKIEQTPKLEKSLKSFNSSTLLKTTALSANTVEHDIIVDNSSEKILINVEMNPIGTIRLYKPDGTEVVDGDTGVSINKTSVNQSMIVENPTVGTWKVSVEGNAGQNYDIDIDMVTEIRIIDFSFAEVKGRAGHEGLFPVDGQPLNTTEQYIVLTVAGDIKTLGMHLVNLDGTKIKDIALTVISKNEISADYFGKVELPSQSFRVVAIGEDTAGASFERTYNQVYIGQTVVVKPVTKKPILLQANKEAEIIFNVENTGVADTFLLEATKEDGSVISLIDSEITIAHNESKEIRVKFVAPDNVGDKSNYNITLLAKSKGNSESNNYAIYAVEVDNIDTDGDGVSDKMEDFIYDGNKDGIADSTQSSVISILSESAIGFTLELKSGDFTNTTTSEVPKILQETIVGEMPFGVFDFEVLNVDVATLKEMKIIYTGNIYPTEYHRYDELSSSWVKDETAVFEKGYATIKFTGSKQKGFFVFNNKRPSAFVEKQKISKNGSVVLDLLENSNDEDGDIIKITHIDSVSNKDGSIAVEAGSESKVTYTAPNDFEGTDYFQYKITDNKGGYYSVDVEIEVEKSY